MESPAGSASRISELSFTEHIQVKSVRADKISKSREISLTSGADSYYGTSLLVRDNDKKEVGVN